MLNFLAETFRLGLKNLHLHKLRSLLTALGIILGVFAVIVMVAIGEGTKQAALEQIEQLGATNILLRSTIPPESNQASQRTQRILQYGLKRVDLQLLQSIPDFASIVPIRNTEQKVTRDNVRAAANAIGTVPEAVRVINLQLAQGRFFSQVEYDATAHVCVLGAEVAKQLFPFQDPIGQEVMVGTAGRSTVMVTVIGILEPTGLRAGSEGASMVALDPDKSLYFPLSVAQEYFGDTVIVVSAGSIERKEIQLSEIWLQAADKDQVERLSKVAENVVKLNHPALDYEVKAPIQILRAAQRTSRMFNFIMVTIASFALVVGGIGIMNIMLASVTERTKEIGIRRALGAKRKHITLQFLIETTVISLTGGLIGISSGSAVAKMLPTIAAFFGGNYPTSITTWSVLGSFVVSGVIGIGFGLYPAVMAARMNPIDALRHA